MRWLLIDDLTSTEDLPIAACADIDGLFFDVPPPPLERHTLPPPPPLERHTLPPPPPLESHALQPPATLVGCRPEPPLRAALDALARGDGNPGGARHRRFLNTSVHSVADDGQATRTFCTLQGRVTGVRPSSLGDGLLDVSFDAGIGSPMPLGAREIWERSCTSGRPTEPGLWARYDSRLRFEWAGAALCHHRHGVPDRPAGMTYHLDGRQVTDITGFYCAIGEAINGPGGYFGWNFDALKDCVGGGWGAAWPVRLVWHDSAVARAHLVAGYDRRAWSPDITFDEVLGWLAEVGIDVELR